MREVAGFAYRSTHPTAEWIDHAPKWVPREAHYCDFSLFSLLWPGIYSQLDRVRRRNSGFWYRGPKK
jgi:hypothetical protein